MREFGVIWEVIGVGLNAGKLKRRSGRSGGSNHLMRMNNNWQTSKQNVEIIDKDNGCLNLSKTHPILLIWRASHRKYDT